MRLTKVAKILLALFVVGGIFLGGKFYMDSHPSATSPKVISAVDTTQNVVEKQEVKSVVIDTVIKVKPATVLKVSSTNKEVASIKTEKLPKKKSSSSKSSTKKVPDDSNDKNDVIPNF